MASHADAKPETATVASFPTRHAAERMLASLGREFRHAVRKRRASAIVCTANKDGSLKVRESLTVRSGNFVNTVMHVSVSWTVGFIGMFSTLKAAAGEVRARHVHERHVEVGEHPAHAILAEVRPNAAIVLVRCSDEAISSKLAARVAETATCDWNGSLNEFLDSLDPGSQDDWVRNALGEPSSGPAT
jgi:hypothetical protein